MPSARAPAGIAVACVAAAGLAAASEPAEMIGHRFQPYSACVLIDTRDRHNEQHVEYRPSQCQQALSPCSTFKIPHALIGLQLGALSGPEDRKPWDGTVRQRSVSNRDHSLASAIEHSVVWYFQALAHDIGMTDMQAWLARMTYGNQDLSSGIDRFWLGASLKIDAYAQLELIKRLWRDGLPFDSKHQATVRDMLRQPGGLPGTLYGKTGSCRGDAAQDALDHGWFIGWVEWTAHHDHNPATSWFAVNIIGENASGHIAREMTIALLHDLKP